MTQLHGIAVHFQCASAHGGWFKQRLAEAAITSVASIKSASQTVLGSALGKAERPISEFPGEVRPRYAPQRHRC